MSHFKNPTFEFHTDGHSKVIAVSSFAGQTVRGVAKCAPNDEFDLEYGKRLAAARCVAKIASKRVKRAEGKVNAAFDAVNSAIAHLYDMLGYSASAEANMTSAMAELTKVSSEKANIVVVLD